MRSPACASGSSQPMPPAASRRRSPTRGPPAGPRPPPPPPPPPPPRRADVVVMIVPLMLSDEQEPDYRMIDPASESVGPGLRPGSLVIYETTLPVGDTRRRFGPLLEGVGGLPLGAPVAGLR